jgi:hypothetical protein
LNWLQVDSESDGPTQLRVGQENLDGSEGDAVRKTFVLMATLVLAGVQAVAKEPQAGTIVSESSVACGSQQVKNKKETTDVLCQQYVIRTETTEYHVRQEKPADKALIPVNTSVEFTLDKDKMKFKANGKKYEYLVVSEGPAPATAAAAAPKP